MAEGCVKNSARERLHRNRKLQGAPPEQKVDVGFLVRVAVPDQATHKVGSVI